MGSWHDFFVICRFPKRNESHDNQYATIFGLFVLWLGYCTLKLTQTNMDLSYASCIKKLSCHRLNSVISHNKDDYPLTIKLRDVIYFGEPR